MTESDPPTPDRVAALVLANRVIRAPDYRADHDEGVRFTDLERGLQWGADAIPALLGLFLVERAPRSDRPDGWVGFARHWRGGTLRLDFDLVDAGGESAPILVVTAISGRAGTETIVEEDVGAVAVPDEIPTESEWAARDRRYQAARRDDDGDGTAAVQAWIAALSGWKRAVAEQFDELVERAVPEVHRAVRYHQPFYGVVDRGWFASVGAFTTHVKLTFVCASALEPEPPSGSGPTRQSLDVAAVEGLDEAPVASWVRQAAADPGMAW